MHQGGGGCSELRSQHCPPAWATERDSVSKKEKGRKQQDSTAHPSAKVSQEPGGTSSYSEKVEKEIPAAPTNPLDTYSTHHWGPHRPDAHAESCLESAQLRSPRERGDTVPCHCSLPAAVQHHLEARATAGVCLALGGKS